MDNEQRCGTCKWWKQDKERAYFGDCEWGDGIVPEWAISEDCSNMTTREFGKDCPTWQTK